MKILKIAVLSFLAMSLQTPKAAGLEDVQWCLTGDADSTILQQPMKDYCPQVAAGALVGVWYAPQYAGLVMSMNQQEWSRKGAQLACNKSDPVAQTAAVGLLAACQCHNRGAADWILSNPGATLTKLREYQGCQ